MKTYEQCPKEVGERVAHLIHCHYAELKKLGLTVDLLFVSHDGEGPALKHQGYAALAVVRKTGAKDRANGRGDAEIVIDREAYDSMSEVQRDALLDHELYHLVALKDAKHHFKFDGQGRPALRIRRHDQQMGWFDEIARRHGENSCEVRQARQLIASAGQVYFDFMKHSKLSTAA